MSEKRSVVPISMVEIKVFRADGWEDGWKSPPIMGIRQSALAAGVGPEGGRPMVPAAHKENHETVIKALEELTEELREQLEKY